MLSLIIAAVTIAIVVYLLVKGYYPQAALFIGGLILLTCTWVFGLGTLLPAKTTTHFGGFDVFKVFSDGFASRIGGLGLMLMAIGGFSRYMEHVGASSAFFRVFEKPLKHIHNPYLLLGAAFIVEQIMVIFVPSHAGLGLLLMCTLYPILVRSGVSPLSALGVIGCCQFLDVGPGSGNANMAAQVAGMDVSEYFVYYQLPLFIALVVILTFVHMFVQAWWDKREGWKFDPKNVQTFAGTKPAVDVKEAPKIYAILPVIPLFLIIFFSKVAGSAIRMDVVTAMVISTVIAIICELIRYRNLKEVLATFKLFFEGMGKILVSVVSLIVCGEFFAQGLIKSGAMGTLITAADQAGFGLAAMVIVGGRKRGVLLVRPAGFSDREDARRLHRFPYFPASGAGVLRPRFLPDYGSPDRYFRYRRCFLLPGGKADLHPDVRCDDRELRRVLPLLVSPLIPSAAPEGLRSPQRGR